MKKRTFKWIRRILLFLLVYETSGALLPFIHTKKTGGAFTESYMPESFYSDTVSPDRARIVEASVDALDTRLQMIHEAKERIVLSTFDIRPGTSCLDIFSSLTEAADRGVKVRILVDGMYGSLHMNRVPLFYAVGTNSNIEIKFYNIPNPLLPWTINGRMHDKYLMVDDKLLLMGGRNTFDYFLGEYNLDNLSYDRDILIYNTNHGKEKAAGKSVLSDMDAYFQAMWDSGNCRTVFDRPSPVMAKKTDKAAGELKEHYKALAAARPEATCDGNDYEAQTIPIRKATLIHNPTHIYGKEPWVWYQLHDLMAAAREKVYIHTPYAVFSRDMYAGMAEIAAKVPEAAMLVNSTAVGDNFMASSDYTRNRGKILDTGITVFEYFGDRSSHGKSFLIDDRISVIGSYNLDMRSTYVNTETMLVIDGEEFNQNLEHHLNTLEGSSLKVNTDGTYESKPDVPAKELPPVKKFIFAITSRLFQLIRYLI